MSVHACKSMHASYTADIDSIRPAARLVNLVCGIHEPLEGDVPGKHRGQQLFSPPVPFRGPDP